MRLLLRSLFVWDLQNDVDFQIVTWACAQHRRVLRDFCNHFYPVDERNYLHYLEDHLNDFLYQSLLYPYAADPQESLQGWIKKAKLRFSNQGGGTTTASSRFDWMRQVLVRHTHKQYASFNSTIYSTDWTEMKTAEDFIERPGENSVPYN
jgi:hypothetical protein